MGAREEQNRVNSCMTELQERVKVFAALFGYVLGLFYGIDIVFSSDNGMDSIGVMLIVLVISMVQGTMIGIFGWHLACSINDQFSETYEKIGISRLARRLVNAGCGAGCAALIASFQFIVGYVSFMKYINIVAYAAIILVMFGEFEFFLSMITEKLGKSSQKIKRLNLGVLQSLVRIIEAKDEYTEGHSRRVADYSVKIADVMGIKDVNRLNRLKVAALLHDIGKVGIPDNILLKEEKLDDREYAKIMEHPVIGADLLASIPGMEDITEIIRCHHERPDGRGYPMGAVRHMPMESKIIGVADAFDAMTSERPYRRALSIGEAMDELIKHSGTQFDDVIVNAMKMIYKHEDSGTGQKGDTDDLPEYIEELLAQ